MLANRLLNAFLSMTTLVLQCSVRSRHWSHSRASSRSQNQIAEVQFTGKGATVYKPVCAPSRKANVLQGKTREETVRAYSEAFCFIVWIAVKISSFCSLERYCSCSRIRRESGSSLV